MNICVNGSREFSDYFLLDRTLEERLGKDKSGYKLILGGARGADRLAQVYAELHNVQFQVITPDWDKHGRKAGILRNIEMLKISQELISFWDGKSPGTSHAIQWAKANGIPTTIIRF